MSKSTITVSIIGCGKVGRLLGKLLQTSGLYKVSQLYNRCSSLAKTASHFIGAGRVITQLKDLEPTDMYCLCVSDDAIATVCDQLVSKAQKIYGQPGLIFHTSGALSSTDTLQSAVSIGLGVGSWHPALPVSDIGQAFDSFSGTYCAVESIDAAVCDQLSRMTRVIGGHSFLIQPDQKLLYHSALVMASNYMNVLVQTGLDILTTLSIPHDKGLAIIQPLVKHMVDRVFESGPTKASTGPIVRGECQLLKQQLAALGDVDADLQALYRHLGQHLIRVASCRESLSEAQLKELNHIFHKQND